MTEKRGSRRKTLTGAQLEEPEAIELLALLQGLTDDGRLLDEEVEALRVWLDENRESDLPGVAYLRDAVEVVLEDGRVSEEERRFLQKAVERVMPKDERDVAVLRRSEAEALAKPIATFDVMVAGVPFIERPDLVRRMCRHEDRVFLVREPMNEHSPNAIRLRMENGYEIGYVPEYDAKRLAPLLDAEALQSATVKKILAGKRVPTPVVWGELYQAEAAVDDALPMDAAPSKADPRSLPAPRARRGSTKPDRTGGQGTPVRLPVFAAAFLLVLFVMTCF